MSDVPRTPAAGAIALSGYPPLLLAGGHTVFGPAASMWGHQNQVSNAGACSHTMVKTLSVNELTLNIRTAVGYLPAGVTVFAFAIASADLDSGGSALVQSLYVGDSVLVTGITAGAGGTTGFHPCVPTKITAATAVYLNTTTSATTPAAGEVSVTALYYAS